VEERSHHRTIELHTTINVTREWCL